MITLARLKDLLEYNPETGVFTWRYGRKGTKAGTRAGSMDRSGYISVYIDGRNYFAHRLAWFYTYGVWPKGDIDHKNTLSHDNKLSNLREGTRAQNNANSYLRRDNTSGLKGVNLHVNGKWRATIVIAGKQKHLGLYKTKEEASEVYKNKARELFGEFFREKHFIEETS